MAFDSFGRNWDLRVGFVSSLLGNVLILAQNSEAHMRHEVMEYVFHNIIVTCFFVDIIIVNTEVYLSSNLLLMRFDWSLSVTRFT